MGKSRHKLGILGGMGPLASAAFVQTLYRMNGPEENRIPPVSILLSDPSFPDRSEAILSGQDRLIIRRLTQALEVLYGAGASKIIIACISLHYFLPRLPKLMVANVISLVDLLFSRLTESNGHFLLLTSGGARAGRLFESNSSWPSISERLVLPGDRDQERLRYWLDSLKIQDAEKECADWLLEVADKYNVDGLIFGCTDLHLLYDLLAVESKAHGVNLSVVDPLTIAAETIGVLLE